MNYYPIIHELGIKYESKINDGWLKCHCISGIHKDENPSMGIHLNTGVIHCFACGLNTNIYKLIQQRLNISYKEAIKHVNGETDIYIPQDPVQNLKQEVPENKIYVQPKQNYPFVSMPLTKPEDYQYTKLRGYTKEYCEEFNIEVALSGLYEDYFIIPIVDTEQQFISFEARKLMQYESLNKYIISNPIDFSILTVEEIFREIIKMKKEQGVELTATEKRLQLNKVLYPSGHKVNTTIFNIDNLNFGEDLILFEGLATHPKVYQYVFQNCTSIFGANLSNEQLLILKQFKKNIIVISDNDNASYALIKRLNQFIENVKVFDCITDDKKASFVDDINKANIISAAEFLVKREYY